MVGFVGLGNEAAALGELAGDGQRKIGEAAGRQMANDVGVGFAVNGYLAASDEMLQVVVLGGGEARRRAKSMGRGAFCGRRRAFRGSGAILLVSGEVAALSHQPSVLSRGVVTGFQSHHGSVSAIYFNPVSIPKHSQYSRYIGDRW